VRSYKIEVLIDAENSAPVFLSDLEDISVEVNTTVEMTLPEKYDEDGDSITVNIYQLGTSNLPSFVEL